MRKSIFLKKGIDKLPEEAKIPARRILDFLYQLETLKLDKKGDTDEALFIKDNLWREMQSFKSLHPDSVKLLYKEFKKAKQATKEQMEISIQLNQAMIELRMLTSNAILADEFKKECLNVDSIAYIKDQMVNGCIPCEFVQAAPEYRTQLTELSKAILEAQKNDYFIPSVMKTYQRVMGWEASTSKEKIQTLIACAEKIADKSLLVDP